MARGIAVTALMLALAGCATIMEGTSQTIIVDVVPAHGRCEVLRDGVALGQRLFRPRYEKSLKSPAIIAKAATVAIVCCRSRMSR